MKIYIKPRIHLSLISMHTDGYRINGGVGFAINKPDSILTFKPSNYFAFEDKRDHPFSQQEKEQIISVMGSARDACRLEHCINVEVAGGLYTHCGMGSGTAIRLACLEALFLLNGRVASEDEIVTYSNRGGTSGIGIRTYFHGGVIFDLGVKNAGQGFAPSSQIKNSDMSTLLGTASAPDWGIGLCIPRDIRPKTQKEEVVFFKETCPIAKESSYEALYHCLFGAYASLKEGDRKQFEESVGEIQKCEWKKKERTEYGGEIERLENELYNQGATCVGMSSLGPLLFFMAAADNFKSLAQHMKERKNCDVIISTFSNAGRRVEA